MSKLIQAFLAESHGLQNCGLNFSKPLLSLIASSSRFSHDRAFSTTRDLNPKNSVLADYLIGSLKFSKDKALKVSNGYTRTKSLEKPQKVVLFFKGLGFSDSCIQSIARAAPSVLFYDVEKTLKPKVALLQDLGLRDLIFRNPFVLTRSPDRTLRPSITLIKKVLESDGRCRNKEQVNQDLLRILTSCSSIFNMPSRLETNILYLRRSGVVGSQLSSLLLGRSRLFVMPKEKVEGLVSRAVDMDFDMGSRMLAHAISVISFVSIETLNGRFEMFKMFGFSKSELASMFRKAPNTFGLSEANLRRKLEFFLNNIKIDRLVLVGYPRILCCSLEGRLIPRYNAVELLKSKRLVRRDLGLQQAMGLSDERFLEKFILPFQNDVQELVVAWKGKLSKQYEGWQRQKTKPQFLQDS